MKLFIENFESIYCSKNLNVIKIIFIIFLLNLIMFFKVEVYAGEIGTYEKDYFGEEYSNGYIRNRNSDDIIRISSGISVKTGKQINSSTAAQFFYNWVLYTSNNTSKSEYIDYFQVARTINNNGEPIWLDMRAYVWTNDENYPWALYRDSFTIVNLYKQNTTIELHFYTTGHCGEDSYEQTFKGVTRMADLDPSEGFIAYSGYNKFYLKEKIPVIYVQKGNSNSTHENNPFNRTGIAENPYFFGTRENNSTDNVWIEINSTPASPFKIAYGSKNARGMFMYYTGTAVEYYINGLLKDVYYYVPYSKYKLINPSVFDDRENGYILDGWYTDTNYNNKAENGITGENVLKVYGKYNKESYTITVDNQRNGHIYNSYQVFQGNYYEKKDEVGKKISILSNIEWSKELQKEIVTDNEQEKGKTHGDKIIEILKEKNPDLYKDCQIADDIAQILQGKPNDGEIIREFTDIVGRYILDNDIPITKGTSTVVQEKDENGNIVSNYKIKDLAPGYYIVIDAEVNEKDDAYSRYLIDVVQDVMMYPKTSIPRLNKKVIGNNIKIKVEGTGSENPVQYIEDEKRNTAIYKKEFENYNAADYDIEFELKSYIPDVTGYNTYKFEVVDILGKGFDYDRNSVKVMLGENEYPKIREKIIKDENVEKISNLENTENPEETIKSYEDKKEIVENYTIRDVVITEENYNTYKIYFEEDGKEYPEGYAESNYGKTLILIELKDFVEQVNAGIVEKGQDIFVRYNAKLNGKGEVGNTPNINEAYVKYSNDPYNNDKESQTTTQTTYTYTIDLDLIKIAELKDESSILNYLEGAEFEIYNKPETEENRTPIATVTTNELGKALYSSLGAGTYYIKETKSPEGYNKLREEIVIEVKATCDEYGTITWEVEEKNNNNLLLLQIVVKEKTEIPEIKLQVENISGLQLPVTGGNGILFFTIVGLNMMVIAIVSFKLTKTNKYN